MPVLIPKQLIQTLDELELFIAPFKQKLVEEKARNRAILNARKMHLEFWGLQDGQRVTVGTGKAQWIVSSMVHHSWGEGYGPSQRCLMLIGVLHRKDGAQKILYIPETEIRQRVKPIAK